MCVARCFLLVTSSQGMQVVTYEGHQVCTIKFPGKAVQTARDNWQLQRHQQQSYITFKAMFAMRTQLKESPLLQSKQGRTQLLSSLCMICYPGYAYP